MDIFIKDTDLQHLLQNHKRDIGRSSTEAVADIFSGTTVAVQTFFTGYHFIVKWSLMAFGIFFAIYGMYSLYKARYKQYSHKQLYKDIVNMNQIKHPFSIVAIKDSFNQYPNRFLLQYDKRWKCNMFFSFPTLQNEEDNVTNIQDKLSGLLKIDPNKIKLEYKTDSIYSKFSVSDQIIKWYDHRIYQGSIDQFSDFLKQEKFQIEGVKYSWMTIDAMKNDPNIQEKNMDVVNLVETNIR